jgi:hypothetical protein
MDSAYTDVWEYKIKKAFDKKEKSTSVDILWQIVSLIFYQNVNDTLLIEIFKLFKDDKKKFIELISLLDGRKFEPPNKKQLEESLLLSVLYYEKEIENKSWEEIKKSFDFEIPTVKYGILIKNMNNWLKQKIQEILKKEGLL